MFQDEDKSIERPFEDITDKMIHYHKQSVGFPICRTIIRMNNIHCIGNDKGLRISAIANICHCVFFAQNADHEKSKLCSVYWNLHS